MFGSLFEPQCVGFDHFLENPNFQNYNGFASFLYLAIKMTIIISKTMIKKPTCLAKVDKEKTKHSKYNLQLSKRHQ